MTRHADDPAEKAPLRGVGVLVTRPAHQAEPLCQSIEELGGCAYRFPVLEIVDPEDEQPLLAVIEQLEDFDYAVFVSANAVSRALARILAARSWPASVRIAVIGKRSAEELEQFGLTADVCPADRFNSEALLELPPMQQVGGKRFVIFRGDGGREYLADMLRARGAQVQYVEAYRRVCPQADSTALLQRWQAGAIDVVLVNSAESLENLIHMVGETGRRLLARTQLLVVSDRMLAVVAGLGLESPPLVADNATDAAVLKALLAWKSSLS